MTTDGILGLCECPHHSQSGITCEMGTCCEPCPTCGHNIANNVMQAHLRTHDSADSLIVQGGDHAYPQA